MPLPLVEDLKLNYDPEFPQQRFLALEPRSSTGRLPGVPPWPAGTGPTAAPLATAPADTADLSQFKGYDALVVTWTSAEAAALAALFTPEYLPSRWYEYRYNVAAYIPLVTGKTAPFNDAGPENARYYHSLGLYFPCTIGKARVLLFKSGLHLDYDGPATPVKKLMLELATTIQPKVFITTGTGGGIGSTVTLGDVIIAGQTKFDCTGQFKALNGESYPTSALPAGALAAITPELTKVNAARVQGGRPVPRIWSGPGTAIVTTDFFAFDDSTNYYKLQGLGQACDMGDAMVGQALQGVPGLSWYAIRNASDPQIPNPTNNIEAAKTQAGNIYTTYGAFTTAASAIASWAVIHATFNAQGSKARAAAKARKVPVAADRKRKPAAPATKKAAPRKAAPGKASRAGKRR